MLTTKHDFYATHEALRLRTERDGVAVRQVELYADPATAAADEIVGKLVAAVGPRTRVVAVTWVHSSTGVRLPIRAIADALAGRDVLLCVDGVHGFGAVDADTGEPGLRLPRLRLPQVAARSARHRAWSGAPSAAGPGSRRACRPSTGAAWSPG